jgi:hypothetical protein
MATDLLLLVCWQGMALENMDLLLLCHPSDTKVGFQIPICIESAWITWMMATGGEISLIGHLHWTGITEIVVETVSPMKGKDSRGGHCHPLLLFCRHFLPIEAAIVGLGM